MDLRWISGHGVSPGPKTLTSPDIVPDLALSPDLVPSPDLIPPPDLVPSPDLWLSTDLGTRTFNGSPATDLRQTSVRGPGGSVDYGCNQRISGHGPSPELGTRTFARRTTRVTI